MATQEDFKIAFAASPNSNIVVETSSGKKYWVHEDQIESVMADSLIYGSPVEPHPRAKTNIVWFKPCNVKIERARAAL